MRSCWQDCDQEWNSTPDVLYLCYRTQAGLDCLRSLFSYSVCELSSLFHRAGTHLIVTLWRWQLLRRSCARWTHLSFCFKDFLSGCWHQLIVYAWVLYPAVTRRTQISFVGYVIDCCCALNEQQSQRRNFAAGPCMVGRCSLHCLLLDTSHRRSSRLQAIRILYWHLIKTWSQQSFTYL